MPIICSAREFTSRTNQIPKLLSPLIPEGRRIASSRAISPKNSIVLAAYSGSSPIDSKYTDWRFKTSANNISGCYYEIWSVAENNSFTLNCAYLQIIKSDAEVLSLHCDPMEPATSKRFKYKSGPHIHIKHPYDEIISNAHIALNLENYQTIISSLSLLENSFLTAIKMIKDEFLV